MNLLRWLLRHLFRLCFRLDAHGLGHLADPPRGTLFVANHLSYLDAVLLWAFLPADTRYVMHTQVARWPWLRPLLARVPVLPMDPANPHALKGLVAHLRQGGRACIFPEGRITTTGAQMKVYPGAALAAVKTRAPVVPIHLEGLEETPFSRVLASARRRLFPRVTLTVLPARPLAVAPGHGGKALRAAATRALEDLMAAARIAAGPREETLFAALAAARRRHGGRRVALVEADGRTVTYDGLLTRSLALGAWVRRNSRPGERLGLLLPTGAAAVTAFYACSGAGRVPALLNFSLGARPLGLACATAGLTTVVTARRFLAQAGLESLVDDLPEGVRVVYLEDVAAGLGALDKGLAWLRVRTGALPRGGDRHEPAVVLFTSGSEGAPKGVVLSHANLLANQAQLAARVDFNAADVVLNALPLFHSFGLTAGTLLPLSAGMRTVLYPSPLHYRVIPELAYQFNATVLFGTNTFLAGYGRHAHPYDFHRLRYVFAGAEPLAATTRSLWQERFGIRIFEGYGATETAPVLALNTPLAHRPGTVGRLLPGVSYRLEPVAGVRDGGRLLVSGPNVMQGYLRHDDPGTLHPPRAGDRAGWYDTGDVVAVDGDGFVTVLGRVKRFAKVGGEMVSLGAVEELVRRLWPEAGHAVVARPDPVKGEQLVLVTEWAGAERGALASFARGHGVAEIQVPRRVVRVPALPLLGSGKLDYRRVAELAREVA